MTYINLTEHNTKCYGVTFQNNGYIKIQKSEDFSDDKNIIYKVKPMEIFLGKIESCIMAAMSGAYNAMLFDGNTIVLKVGEGNDKHGYVYTGGNMICTFLTIGKNFEYISNMGNSLTPYSIAIG